jgi:hypothetical protein
MFLAPWLALTVVAAAAASAREGDFRERRGDPAVDLQTMEMILEGDRVFVQGTVANSASYTVHNVRVCIKGMCGYAVPSTVQPGKRARFRVPARLERYESGPDYRITWDFMSRRGN